MKRNLDDFLDDIQNDLQDDETTFGMAFDEGQAFRAQDHIDAYLAEQNAETLEAFESIIDLS